MSRALRAGIALCAVSVVACDSVLGLKDLVSDGAPAKLSFSLVTTTGAAQQPLDVLTVSILDIQGRPALGFSDEVKLTLGNNPGGANLIGTTTATATGAAAIAVYFDAVGVDRPAKGYTLVASAAGLEPATSNPIDVVAAPFTPVATGVFGGPITSVAISPAPAGGTRTVWAGAGNGVYASVDGGASWKLASFGADVAARLVADPKHPGVVYSAPHTNALGFLRKTVDGGATWHRLGLGDSDLSSSYVLSFDVDPKDPSVIYVADGARLRRSTDGGANWSSVALVGACRQVAIDPVTTSSIYCTAFDSSTGQSLGVYKSSDSSATWGAVNTGLPTLSGRPLDTGQLLATPSAIFVTAGGTLYHSTDAGASWTSLSIMFPGVMAYAPSMPNRIYLAQGAGVSVSNDAGVSFGQAVVVTPTDSVQAMTVDPTNADVVYAGGFNDGVFVSTNGGVSWSSSSSGIEAQRVPSVAMASDVSGTVLASVGANVLRTTNSGTSWTMVVQASNATVQFDPDVSTRVYVCGFRYFATSTSGGVSFVGGNNPDIPGCHRLAIAGATLFAAGNGRLSKSTNSGTTWADTGLGATAPVFSVNDVALGDGTGSVVVASTSQGVYRSTNGGTTFTQVTTDFNNVIVADPRAPTHIIAGECSSFRISADGGASFGALIPGLCVQSLIGTHSALYAAGSGPSNAPAVVTSTDGGSSWAPIELAGSIPSGLNLTSITASDDGKTIYLGTSAGLYKSAGP